MLSTGKNGYGMTLVILSNDSDDSDDSDDSNDTNNSDDSDDSDDSDNFRITSITIGRLRLKI